ncbi:hypothetical protein Cadr_000013897 [Camelus dromedarius]|uniref:Uncharacterized protein n=1 Tax=Camelus dromedarius TaxID=9838 RepID=A0A5N4D9Z6_CAMDR|nr:hypothetical protein Cadr_000013897 [Camelus dromedarius]KAB1268005.1 hypothetical protein Cadr_000013897 [Camelus dromedarius]
MTFAVTLKISSKEGTRIQASLFLGQNSPPDWLPLQGRCAGKVCTVKEAMTRNGSRHNKKPMTEFSLSEASAQGYGGVRHLTFSPSSTYMFLIGYLKLQVG